MDHDQLALRPGYSLKEAQLNIEIWRWIIICDKQFFIGGIGLMFKRIVPGHSQNIIVFVELADERTIVVREQKSSIAATQCHPEPNMETLVHFDLIQVLSFKIRWVTIALQTSWSAPGDAAP